MTSRDFCYWLQGYFEILDPAGIAQLPMGPVQVEVMRKHLALVLKQAEPALPTWTLSGNDTSNRVTFR